MQLHFDFYVERLFQEKKSPEVGLNDLYHFCSTQDIQ